MTALSGFRELLHGGEDARAECCPRRAGLPHTSALPLSLGSLEHEFGGLHIRVFGHSSGDTV